MPVARVPYPDPKSLTTETRDILRQMQPLNIFRMMAGGEGLLRAFSRMGNYLLFRTRLDPVLREIAIIRVGALSNAAYEVSEEKMRYVGPDIPAMIS